jgi:hypothetical protein
MDNTVTTTHGLTLTVYPVPRADLERIAAQVRKQFEQRGEILEPPTYTVETPIGTEIYPHDEISIADASEEEKEKWQRYQDAQRRMMAEIWLRNMRLAIIRGLRLKPDDVPQEWLEEQRLLELEVPDDPMERLLTYVRSALLPTELDVQRVIAKALSLSMLGMVGEEEVAAMEASFLGGMGGRRRAENTTPEGAGDSTSAPQGALGVQPGDGNAAGSTLLASDPVAVAAQEQT